MLAIERLAHAAVAAAAGQEGRPSSSSSSPSSGQGGGADRAWVLDKVSAVALHRNPRPFDADGAHLITIRGDLGRFFGSQSVSAACLPRGPCSVLSDPDAKRLCEVEALPPPAWARGRPACFVPACAATKVMEVLADMYTDEVAGLAALRATLSLAAAGISSSSAGGGGRGQGHGRCWHPRSVVNLIGALFHALWRSPQAGVTRVCGGGTEMEQRGEKGMADGTGRRQCEPVRKMDHGQTFRSFGSPHPAVHLTS